MTDIPEQNVGFARPAGTINAAMESLIAMAEADLIAAREMREKLDEMRASLSDRPAIHPMLRKMAESMAAEARVPVDIGWRLYVGHARAAVSALLDPDESQILAGEQVNGYEFANVDAYRAMLLPLLEAPNG